jgi:hypothetical protein
MLSCPSDTAKEHRSKARSPLENKLMTINTHLIIQIAMLFGLDSFTNTHMSVSKTRNPYCGSIMPTDMMAANCITSQSLLGWSNFLQGSISKKWLDLYNLVTSPKSDVQAIDWVKKMINTLWNYIDSLWKHRNSVIYGKNKLEAAELDKKCVCDEVRIAYQSYLQDPFMKPRNMSYLFDKKTLEEQLKIK